MFPKHNARLRCAIAACAVGLSVPASAGGMVLPVRGVRDLARAGAFVAGADDADALWLDPAGLAHADGDGTKAFLFDAAFVGQTVDYTRIASTGQALAPVSNQQPGAVIPTLAASLGIGDRLVIAGGIAEPYAGASRYDSGGAQRYASVGTSGSMTVVVALGVAYAVTDQLRVGATVQDAVTSLDDNLVVSACPGTTPCAAEDRAYDAPIEVRQNGYLSPSGSVGVQYDAAPEVTLGLAVQGPTKITGNGTFTMTLPAAPELAGAKVVGDSATLSYWLPPAVRAGIELHVAPALRVEAALDVELWSIQDAISIAPDGVTVQNTPGGMTYPVAAMRIARGGQTSYAPAVGAEYAFGAATVAAGVSYETSATPTGDVSVLAVDAPKWLVGLGGGYAAEGWQLGGAAGLVSYADVDVPLAGAKVEQLQPLRDPQTLVPVNAGSYHARDIVVGLRAARRF